MTDPLDFAIVLRMNPYRTQGRNTQVFKSRTQDYPMTRG